MNNEIGNLALQNHELNIGKSKDSDYELEKAREYIKKYDPGYSSHTITPDSGSVADMTTGDEFGLATDTHIYYCTVTKKKTR